MIRPARVLAVLGVAAMSVSLGACSVSGAQGQVRGRDAGRPNTSSHSSARAAATPASAPDYSSVKRLMISLSYPVHGNGEKGQPQAYTGGGDRDLSRVGAAYKAARKRSLAAAARHGNSIRPAAGTLWADCGAYAATIINTLVDPDYPSVTVAKQWDYLHRPGSGWKRVGSSLDYEPDSYRPGDVFIAKPWQTRTNHTFLWVGDHQGHHEVVSEASYAREGSRSAHLPLLRTNPARTGHDPAGRHYEVWRHVGSPRS